MVMHLSPLTLDVPEQARGADRQLHFDVASSKRAPFASDGVEDIVCLMHRPATNAVLGGRGVAGVLACIAPSQFRRRRTG